MLKDLESAHVLHEKDGRIWVKLSSRYSQKDLSNDNSEITDILSKSKYLDGIKASRNKEGTKEEVALFIGVNCVQA